MKADSIRAADADESPSTMEPMLIGGDAPQREALAELAMSLAVRATGLQRSLPLGLRKALLANCDLPRRNDLDGRGRLSEEALCEFTRFLLETCIDQVRFMEGLLEADRLQARVLLWVDEECRLGHLLPQSGTLMQAVLQRGELPRADLPKTVGTGTRQARRIAAALATQGALTSTSSRAPLRLALPAKLAERWLPGLFPGE